MRLNGFRIQSMLRDAGLKKQTAEAEFEDSLRFFSGEQKSSPEKTMESYVEAERQLAQLQEIQTRYNLAVEVPVRLDEKDVVKMTLQHAVKLIGGASRQEKLWREAATGKKTRYSYRQSDD